MCCRKGKGLVATYMKKHTRPNLSPLKTSTSLNRYFFVFCEASQASESWGLLQSGRWRGRWHISITWTTDWHMSCAPRSKPCFVSTRRSFVPVFWWTWGLAWSVTNVQVAAQRWRVACCWNGGPFLCLPAHSARLHWWRCIRWYCGGAESSDLQSRSRQCPNGKLLRKRNDAPRVQKCW